MTRRMDRWMEDGQADGWVEGRKNRRRKKGIIVGPLD